MKNKSIDGHDKELGFVSKRNFKTIKEYLIYEKEISATGDDVYGKDSEEALLNRQFVEVLDKAIGEIDRLQSQLTEANKKIKELEADKNVLLSDISSIAREIEADMEGEYTCDDIILNIQNINGNYDELEIYNENLKCCGNCLHRIIGDIRCEIGKSNDYDLSKVCEHWTPDKLTKKDREIK